MKNIIKSLIFIGFIGFLTSCEKEELKAVMKSSAKPGLNLSASTLVLAKDKADANAITITWTKPDYGFQAGNQYRLLIDTKGNNFKTPQAFTLGTSLTQSWTHKQFNNLLQAMGFKPNVAANLEVKVESILSPTVVQSSDVSNLVATAYLDKLDLTTTWGLVGSATPGGWNGPDLPFYKTAKNGVYVCYASLIAGEIKVRENNQWTLNYGDTGNDGKLDKDGANIAVKAGSYAITMDINALTIKVENYSWGVVGSAAPNGWNGPDVDFFYDPATDQWRCFVKLVDGEIKFRKSNDWGLNYGDNSANGNLQTNGANIKVSAGIYLITFNVNDLKYTIEKTSIPGIVGSAAPNGWNGPDIQMTRDFGRDGIWIATGVKLVAGEIKIRMNNDWGVNYGDDKADGVMELNGANIAVAAGTYDIELDLNTPAKVTYKITKK